jgi:hypothetical protein
MPIVNQMMTAKRMEKKMRMRTPTTTAMPMPKKKAN